MRARSGWLVLLAATWSGCTTNEPTPSPAQDPIPFPRSAAPHDADPAVLRVVQVTVPPRLDGDLSDHVWRVADVTGGFVETLHGGRAQVSATARTLWDRRNLYVGVEVEDQWLVGPDTTHDSHLWEQDCVELMVRRPDELGYFEIQVSPRGVVFDTRFDDRRVPAPFGHTEWKSEAEAAVSVKGTIDDLQSDTGYTVEIAIPWQAFSPSGSKRRVPAIGDEWRANFFVLDRTRNGQQASSWSPPRIGDFHVPSRFGILRFEGPPDVLVGHEEPVPMPSNQEQPGKRRQQRLESEGARH